MKEIEIILLKNRPYPYHEDKVFEFLKDLLRKDGFHHPITCPDKEGNCHRCSIWMMSNYNQLPDEAKSFIKFASLVLGKVNGKKKTNHRKR